MSVLRSVLVLSLVYATGYVHALPQRVVPATSDDFPSQPSFKSNNPSYYRYNQQESYSTADLSRRFNNEQSSSAATNEVEKFNIDDGLTTEINDFNADSDSVSTSVDKFTPERIPSTGVDYTPGFDVNKFSPSEPFPSQHGFDLDNPFVFMRRMMQHMEQEMAELQRNMESNFKNFENLNFDFRNDFDPSKVKNTSFTNTKVEGNNVITTNERHFGAGDRQNGAEYHYKEVRVIPKQQPEIQTPENRYQPSNPSVIPSENRDVEILGSDQNSVSSNNALL